MLNATPTHSEASCSTQLYYIMVMLCKGTAVTRVVNAGAHEGLEAWRCLVLHHEPTSLIRSAGLLQELLNFSLEGETAARMAQFDRDTDRYEKASGETFPGNIRIGVALRMLPDGPLNQHLVLNSARLATWVILKAEIDNVFRAQAADSSTPQPMDLSAYGTQELDSFQKGKSRGKGKSKGQKQTQGQSSDDAMPDLWQGWSLEERLLVQHPRWLGRGNHSQGQEQGQRRQGQDLHQHPAIEQSQEECEVGATGETTLSGFFLSAFEEEAELNSFESKIAGVLVTGIDSGDARLVVPAGEIPGYSSIRTAKLVVCTRLPPESVFDWGKQEGQGTVDRKV